jgi:hypothetical protein
VDVALLQLGVCSPRGSERFATFALKQFLRPEPAASARSARPDPVTTFSVTRLPFGRQGGPGSAVAVPHGVADHDAGGIGAGVPDGREPSDDVGDRRVAGPAFAHVIRGTSRARDVRVVNSPVLAVLDVDAVFADVPDSPCFSSGITTPPG